MRKAFIAAPLIGTLIFLTAIVFVVNINKAETSRVQEITADAYHNRIVSLLELYRVDLGSLFRESMSRLIESALANPGWSLFDVPFSTNGNPQLSEPERTKQNRFETCTQVSEVMDAVICAKTTTEACNPNNCVSPCAEITDVNGVKSCQIDSAQARTYGLQKWLTNLQKVGTFEGVSFGPANGSRFEDFIDPKRPDGSADTQAYSTNCRALVPGSLFDCVNFAKNNSEPLRCCAQYRRTSDGALIERWDFNNWPRTGSKFEDYACTKIIPGCNAGTFFVQIKVEDERVFPHLPRLQATDQGGNEIRSGAISDTDFQLPIKYPIYKYIDASFRLYDRMAYGKRGTAYPAGSAEVSWASNVAASSYGVVSGVCWGSDCTKAVHSTLHSTFNEPGSKTALNDANADIESLLGEGLASVWSRYPELVFNFTFTSAPPVSCAFNQPCVLAPLEKQIFWGSGVDCRDPGGVPCYLLDALTVRSLIIDETPAFRVNMSTPNAYNWGMTLKATGVETP